MIQVTNLKKYFGPVLAVNNISFEVAKGELVGLLGPNGSGKSTTMRILTTYLPATSGTVTVAGFDVREQSLEVRKHVGYLPESVPLYPEMRVEEYLDFRSKLKGLHRRDRQKRLDYCLERCRIREVRRRLVGTLSKGYKQRVGLADAMIHDPQLLILDEPTSGLDPLQIRDTLELIRELGTSRTILLSTHILSEIEATCKRILVIAHGKLCADKKLTELDQADVLHVTVQGPASTVEAAFKSLPGILEVKREHEAGEVISFMLRAAPGHDLREAVLKQVQSAGWGLRELRLGRLNLEHYFLEAVTKKTPPIEPASLRPTIADVRG